MKVDFEKQTSVHCALIPVSTLGNQRQRHRSEQGFTSASSTIVNNPGRQRNLLSRYQWLLRSRQVHCVAITSGAF
jgi:hypothetical protein